MANRDNQLRPPSRLPSISEMSQMATPTDALALPARLASNCASADATHYPSDANAAVRPKRPPASDMKANLRRSRHRNREKRETMFLRAYSSALESKLEQLKQRQAERKGQQSEGASELVKRSPHRELWRALALMRRRERELSEQENARLRALWRTQLLFVAHLQHHTAVSRNFGPANGYEARVTLQDTDVDLFKALLGDLDGIYSDSGRVMAETGLNCLPEARYHCVRPRDTREAGREAVCAGNVDVISVAQMRTSFSAVQDIMWKSMLAQIATNGGVRFDLAEELRENTAAMKVRHVQQGQDDETLCLETVMVSRRYMVSPDCIVVVWRCLFMGDGGVSGITETESGFTVSCRSVSQPEFYVMRRIRRLETIENAPASPNDQKEGDTSGEAAEKLSSMSLSAIEDDIDSVLGKVIV